MTSLSTQLEELRKLQGGPDTPTHSKKVRTRPPFSPGPGGLGWSAGFCSSQGSSEGAEQASRGKIVLLKKKVEELEQQLAQQVEELENKVTPPPQEFSSSLTRQGSLLLLLGLQLI